MKHFIRALVVVTIGFQLAVVAGLPFSLGLIAKLAFALAATVVAGRLLEAVFTIEQHLAELVKRTWPVGGLASPLTELPPPVILAPVPMPEPKRAAPKRSVNELLPLEAWDDPNR